MDSKAVTSRHDAEALRETIFASQSLINLMTRLAELHSHPDTPGQVRSGEEQEALSPVSKQAAKS